MSKYLKITEEMAAEFLEKGVWMPNIFADFYEKNAKEFPNAEALIDGDTRLTWSQLNLYADRAAIKMVALGIEKGAVGIELTQDCWEHVVMRLAMEKAGVISLPLMRVLRHTEIEHLTNMTRASVIIIPKTYHDFDYFGMIQELKPKIPSLKHILMVGEDVPDGAVSIRDVIQQPLEEKYPDSLAGRRFKPEDLGTLTGTTGSTGFPKVTRWILAAQVTANASHVDAWEMDNNDVSMSLAPLPGLGGTVTYRCSGQAASKMVLIENYSPEEAMRLIEKEKVSIMACVPTQLAAILASPDFDKYDLSSLKVIKPAGGPTAPTLIDEAEDRIGCKILISYGGTDYGSLTHQGVDASHNARRFSVGHPIDNLELKFLDDDGKDANEGEICVKGPCTSDGYWENPEATWETWTKDGWGMTGDLGRLDDEHNLVILGRKKDMIIRGGQNVFPTEIERYLQSHPNVKDVSVVGMPDELMGERVCAFIVPKPGIKEVAFDNVVSFLKEKNMAAYKLPERVENLDELPLAGGQKIDKKALRKDIIEKLAAEV
jgi:non-ribosomal peptide synthetase component E (peptide arylation enzyme)